MPIFFPPQKIQPCALFAVIESAELTWSFYNQNEKSNLMLFNISCFFEKILHELNNKGSAQSKDGNNCPGYLGQLFKNK